MAWEGARTGSSRRLSDELSLYDSRFCLTCHDGTLAGDQVFRESVARADLGVSHPVGVLYPRDPKRYQPPDANGRIASFDTPVGEFAQLIDGRVECGSCHAVHSPRPDLLRVTNRRSALCLSCHLEIDG